MTTPVVAMIQYFVYGVGIAQKLIFALIPVIIGVVIVTCNEVELRLWGFIYAVCGVFSTSFYQVWVKTRQQDLHLSPPQLLYYQAPISAVMVLFLTPLFDQIYTTTIAADDAEIGIVTYKENPNGIQIVGLMDYRFVDHGYALVWVLFSCVLAFCVNLSIFLTIGRTSPISYNVLGHFKLCVITIGGMLFFAEDMNDRKLVGIGVALTGITLYTYWKLQITSNWDKREKKIQVTAGSSSSSSSSNNSSNSTGSNGNIGNGSISHGNAETRQLLENVRIMHGSGSGGVNRNENETSMINDQESAMKNC